jgi:competence protein ComEC
VAILCLKIPRGFSITCLDVGQGDGIVVETSKNHHYLIDGGSSNVSQVGKYRILPYLKSQGISYLDYVWVSHTDQDHISGILEILGLQAKNQTSVTIGNLVLPGIEEKSQNYESLEKAGKEAGVKIYYLNAGARLKDKDLVWKVLSPRKGEGGEENQSSLVLELTEGNFRGLFTGDIDEETEEKLINDLEDVDFLKVAHHGSRYSSGEKFLDVTRPEISLISCSSTNTYGHPSPETLERLTKAKSRVWCTKDCGEVRVEIKKNGLKIKTYLQ